MPVYPLTLKHLNRPNRLEGSFTHLSQDEIETHLRINKYGNFRLPDAVRPSYDLQVVPSEGFRYEMFRDSTGCQQSPVLICSISKEKLFDLFYEFISCFSDYVNVVLESTHFCTNTTKLSNEFRRDWLDVPVLQSILVEYEKYLQSDGCMGISVVRADGLNEVRMDEHKLLYVYGPHRNQFLQILKRHRISYCPEMSFLTDAEHVHLTNDKYWRDFQKLCDDLGILM